MFFGLPREDFMKQVFELAEQPRCCEWRSILGAHVLHNMDHVCTTQFFALSYEHLSKSLRTIAV